MVRIDLSSPEMESFSRGGIVAGGLARRPKIFSPPASIFGFGGGGGCGDCTSGGIVAADAVVVVVVVVVVVFSAIFRFAFSSNSS